MGCDSLLEDPFHVKAANYGVWILILLLENPFHVKAVQVGHGSLPQVVCAKMSRMAKTLFPLAVGCVYSSKTLVTRGIL